MGRPSNPVNQHLSRSRFLIKPFILLTPKNPLKPSGFCANRVTRLGYCNPAGLQFFMKIILLGLLFYFYIIQNWIIW